jgi:23S rRNA G2069 N7-methylase RlmK/C1962 C5-methylase RlmI
VADDLETLLRTRQAERTAQFAGGTTSAWRLCDVASGSPCTVDWYDGAAVAYEKAGATAVPDAALIARALAIPVDAVFVKERRQQKDRQHGGQYQVVARAQAERTVREQGLRFAVNLSDYLDTGLFLDHRPLRRVVGRLANGRRVLNLFAYTGAFTVHAAAGGARETTTVDLSNTYLRWAEHNLAINQLRGQHRMIKADCLRWLGESRGATYDLIICDPPTFSNSKAMARSWEVGRDQEWLLGRLWNLLAPGGTAWFSTNKQGFTLTSKLPPFASVEDITAETIDTDFAGTTPHRCWRLRR